MRAVTKKPVVDIEAPLDRAESVAQQFLGMSATKAFKLLKDGKLPEGSIIKSELSALQWLLRK